MKKNLSSVKDSKTLETVVATSLSLMIIAMYVLAFVLLTISVRAFVCGIIFISIFSVVSTIFSVKSSKSRY